jgi:hypothetical protein
MTEQRSLLAKIVDVIEMHRAERRAEPETKASERPRWLRQLGRQMIPNIGTVLVVVVLLLTVPSLAAPSQSPSATSTSTISYQGRLADSAGNPLTDKYNMEFRIYDVPTGGTPLWTEMWTGANAVDVSDGLFNVMLGSIDNTLASSIENHDELYLGITVGTDSEMAPRVQLGSVPFSMQAMTVPDGSVTTEKIADGAVTSQKMDAIEAHSYVAYQDSTASTDWVDLAHPQSVQLVLETPQIVFFQYKASVRANGGALPYIGLFIDDVLQDGSWLDCGIGLQNANCGGIYRKQLSAGTHTISMRYRVGSIGGSATYWRRHLLAFSVSQ